MITFTSGYVSIKLNFAYLNAKAKHKQQNQASRALKTEVVIQQHYSTSGEPASSKLIYKD